MLPEERTVEEIEKLVRANSTTSYEYAVPTDLSSRSMFQDWGSAKKLIESQFETITEVMLIEEWKPRVKKLDGGERLSIVESKPYRGAIAKIDYQTNVFERLRRDNNLREELQSNLLKVLNNKYFCLWNSEPSQLKAYLSDIEPKNRIEYYDDEEAVRFFKEHATALDLYSDGIKAYIGILVNLIAEDSKFFLIDEPEAFLSPSLCFTLGQTITSICLETDKQVFCASHSPFFLKGCLSIHSNSVSVTRFTYNETVHTANSLSSEELFGIIQNPLLSNIGVVEALFHSKVIVTEGDSDRAFYSEINQRLLWADKNGIENSLFINAQNKQTIAKIIKLLRKIGIPCVAISDIDTLKEGGGNFATILESIGVSGAIASSLQDIRSKVNKYLKNAAKEDDNENSIDLGTIQELLDDARQMEVNPKTFIQELNKKSKDPDYKRLGGMQLLESVELNDAEHLLEQLANSGWFVLPNGEVEQWLQSLNVGMSKGGWLLRVFKAMGADPQHESYVSPPEELDDVWLFISNISDWFKSQSS